MTHIILDKTLFFADENCFCVSDCSEYPFYGEGFCAWHKKIAAESATLVFWLEGGRRDTPKIKK
jgi:hypothetical protein